MVPPLNDARLAMQSLIAPAQRDRLRSGYSLATGPVGLVQWSLPVLASNRPDGERILWVDPARKFDPRPLLRLADDWGIHRFFYVDRLEIAQPRNTDHLERLMVSELLPRSAHHAPVVIADPFHLWDADGLTPEERQERYLRFEEMLMRFPFPCLVINEERRAHLSPYGQRLYLQAARRARLDCVDGLWSVRELSERLLSTVEFRA